MLDALIYLLIFAGIGLGVWKGFQFVLRLCVYAIVVIAGFLAAYIAYPHGAKILHALLPSADLSKIIVFNVVILAIWMPGFYLARRLMQQAFTGVDLKWFDKLFGGLLGVMVILFLVWGVLIGMMAKNIKVNSIANSSFAKTLIYPSGTVYKLLPDNMKKNFEKNYYEVFYSKS
ncbi:MAG: CvpA family protein [Gemmatimonadetes bacterium]|nr:MAG: CvpA family protein [Gemmatimonadota bacterium]